MFDPNTMPYDIPFYSHDERMEAFNHPAYTINATFRAKVERRLELGMAAAPHTIPVNVGHPAQRVVLDSDPARYAEQKQSLEKTYPGHFENVTDVVERAQVEHLGGGAIRVTATPIKVNPLTGKRVE